MAAVRRNLIFIHEGKASYPIIPSLIAKFRDEYQCGEMSLREYLRTGDPANSILWYTMGFYPRKPPALAHIHFYISPSVPPFGRLKDLIKRHATFRPDMRVFQSERVRDEFGFQDDVKYAFLPVGASGKVRELITTPPPDRAYDFGYVGQITKERGMDRVIQSFLNRFGTRSSFLLIGPSDQAIRDRFRSNQNVVFAGRHSQDEAYRLLRSSRVGVAYFPYHRPHCFMIPTKLLEYMAFGMPVLANDSPMNMHFLKKYSYPAVVTGYDIFGEAPEPDAFPKTSPATDPTIFLDYLIDASGLRDAVDRLSRP